MKTDLSKTDQETLRDQVIDEKRPGSILADFETLLGFIGPEGIPVTGSQKGLPMRLLPELNEQMTHPLDIDLKRPRQKSYPNLNGLYLLLRMTGLVYLERSAKKYKLLKDNEILQSWQKLNPTERYFTLLEAWLLRDCLGIIDEFYRFGESYFTCANYFSRLPKKGLQVKGNPDAERSLPYVPGLYMLALMDLFGWISVEHARPAKGKGWRIERIRPTRFGEAILILLSSYFKSEDHFINMADQVSPEFGTLQHFTKPFFPEWRNILAAPRPEVQDGTYVFVVSLGEAKRWIAIPGSMYFEDLCHCILKAFNFDFDHLYQFSFKNRYGILKHIVHPYVRDEPLITDEVRIREAELQSASDMTFLYDFGDNWEFDVVLERIDPLDKKIKKPKVLKSEGEAPDQYPDWDSDW